jgi:tetratricopeptide (TPR) repeat protein/peroxiredoxin
MKPRAVVLASTLGACLAVVLLPFAAAQRAPSARGATDVQEALRKGTDLRNQGDLEGAIRQFDDEREAASRIEDRGARVEAVLQAAQSHQAFVSNDANQGVHFQAAKANYQEVIARGTAAQRAQAQNNLGTLFLKAKDYPGAVQALKGVDTDQIPPSERFIFDYNLGRAYDLSGQPADAFPCYVKAVTANPSFTPAAERAFENLRRSGGPNKVGESLRLADRLLEANRSDIAAREILRCLDAWGDDPEAKQLLRILVRHYTKAKVEPTRFMKEDWPVLDGLAMRRPDLRRGADEVRLAFEGDFEPADPATDSSSDRTFPVWSRLERSAAPGEKTFPKLLNMIGSYYYVCDEKSGDSRDPRRAFARYATAWSLDPANIDAALFSAALLRDLGPKLDPDHFLIDQFADAVSSRAIGKIYKKIPENAVEWAKLMRMHFLLGSIFEGRKAWGSEDDPRSAISQWTDAVAAEDRVRRLDPKYPPTPGLHQQLAIAYKVTDQPRKASEQYLTAAEGFAAANEVASAKSALGAAREFTHLLDVPQRQRLDLLAARLGVGRGRYNRAVAIGDPAPAFSGIPAVMSGEEHSVSLRDIKEDVVVIAFLSPRSPATAAYEDRIKEFVNDYREKGVKLVAISPGGDESARVSSIKEYIHEHKSNYIYAYDEGQSIGRAYGATTTPQFFLLDKERRIRYAGMMDDNKDEAKVAKNYLRDAVNAVLSGKNPAVVETRSAGESIKYKH